MFLKSIRAHGFKSFAEKIELEINKGITGVVGPNGSGKSNIVDAVRWVMGEQSIKSLRGDAGMTDCIFAGSKSRGASLRAMVSLVFDNTDHYLNSEFNEIEIKRVVYKSGENEYFINNSKVRLKDITDLFLDSGAGKESFNIISQGAVGDIINNKPEDRRVIFESAAGVLKYKKRKEESYKKLEKTNENLARVNLLIDELLTTLTPLKEQREKAKKYLDYKEDLEKIEVSLIANDIEILNKNYLQVKEHVQFLTEEAEKLNLNNAIDSSKVEELKLISMKLDNQIEQKNEEVIKVTNEIAELQSQKQITTERKKYEVDNNKLEMNILSLQEEVLKIANDIKSTTDEQEELKKQLENLEQKNKELTKANEMKKANQTHLTNDWNNLNKEIMNIQNKIDIVNTNRNNDTKLPYSVKNIINNIRLNGIHGVLGKLIDTPQNYVTAIETSLGANANVIVVENENNAKEAINYLKENKLGRATFFPISIIKPRYIAYEDKEMIKNVEGFIGTADSLVTYNDLYKNIVLNQLGNVLVVDNINTLNKIGRLIKYKYKIVTLEGEIQYAGGAITGGTSKNSNGLLNQKYELEKLNKELEDKKKKLTVVENNASRIREEEKKTSYELETIQREIIMLTEQLNIKNSHILTIENMYNLKNNELIGTKNKSENTLDQELETIINTYYEKSALKEKEMKDLNKLKKQKSDISTEIANLEKIYREKNSEMTSKQNELKLEEIKLGKMDVKLDNLLLTLNENYNLTYEKAHEEYQLDIDSETARLTVNNLKAKIKSLGEVNTGSISEYERLHERYNFLTTQRDDLKEAVTSLLNVISEMDEIMKEKFVETFNKISQEFKIVFKKLFKGGEGVLTLTNPDDLLNTGIEISALPPGKKLNSIALLSGGEKTLTAISLLFAILNVKPVPFVILDEVEAALDEANVDAFGQYLLSRKERSQFIIITHKKRTMEYADVLYGITMQESGVSKLVSVKLED